MPLSPDAPRLLLFADGPRATGPGTPAKIRRYRLARLGSPKPSRRPESEPRYAYLKRTCD